MVRRFIVRALPSLRLNRPLFNESLGARYHHFFGAFIERYISF